MNVRKWAFLLIAIALTCAAAANGQTPKSKRPAKSQSAAKIQPAAKAQSSPQADAASPAGKAAEVTQAAQPAEVERITVEELKGKLAKNEPVFIIDSRSQGSYDATETKIKGALRIPMDEVESRLSEIPRDKEIVTYCT
jgi:hypothetical protein